MLSFLSLYVTGCGLTKNYVIPYCEEPEWDGETYRDLAVYAFQAKAALETCNAKLDAIR